MVPTLACRLAIELSHMLHVTGLLTYMKGGKSPHEQGEMAW